MSLSYQSSKPYHSHCSSCISSYRQILVLFYRSSYVLPCSVDSFPSNILNVSIPSLYTQYFHSHSLYPMFPFPSRQCLSLPTTDAHHPSSPVVLCTHFCQTVGHSTPTHLSPFPCKQRGVAGLCNLISPEKAPRSTHSMLVKSPAKVGQINTRELALIHTPYNRISSETEAKPRPHCIASNRPYSHRDFRRVK